jgi:hypothetical protein
MTSHGRSHDADGPGTCNKNVFAEYRKSERSMDGVAERIEDGGNFVRHTRAVDPDVGHRQNDIFREGAISIDADAEGVGTEVATTGQAVATASTDDVALAADELADRNIGDVRAGSDDLADKLMANRQTLSDRGAGPRVPLIDVKISAADTRSENANLDVVDTHLGLRNILEP